MIINYIDRAKVINKFIKESWMFGFKIEFVPSKNHIARSFYTSTTKCNHCGEYFTEKIKINVNKKLEIQCNLPIYCAKCIEKRSVIC